MHRLLSKYLLYYPVTLLKGELVAAYMPFYNNFQNKTADEIQAYQLKSFKRIVEYAFKNNQFYKQHYGSGFSLADIRSLDDLKQIPTITKNDLIGSISELSSTKNLFSSSKTTGGSTGQPVRLYKSPDALARERAATWRAYQWAGIEIGDAQARFWGVPHSQSGRFKARIADFAANRLRMSAFQITGENLSKYYKDIHRFGPAYLYGYVSAIDELAKFVISENLSPFPSLKSVITTSEVLTDTARSRICNAFGVKVYNEYGCGEVGSIAHECEHGSMHQMADNLIVEVDSPPGEPGEIIVTDLFNKATPLIRYRLGDYATFDNSKCLCGRSLPVISAIHGRAYDLIRTISGKMIHPESLIYVVEGLQQETMAFRQFQAVQETLSKITISIVPSEKFSDSVVNRLIALLKNDVDSSIDYEIQLCNEIQRESSGKMRLVKGLKN